MKKLMTLLTIVCLAIFVAGCSGDTATTGDGANGDLGENIEMPGGDEPEPSDLDDDAAGSEESSSEGEKEGEDKKGGDN